MNQEKYTQKVTAALQEAQQSAVLHYHQELTSTHLAQALFKEPDGVVAFVLSQCNVDPRRLQARLEEALQKLPAVRGTEGQLRPSTAFVRVLALAEQLAGKMKDEYVSQEHVLLALAEPPVAVVDKYAQKHGTEAVAKAYLEYLYSDEGQNIAAKHFYRPANPAIAKQYADKFSQLSLFTIKDVSGDWETTQKKHFANGGLFDQLYKPGK